MPLTQLKGLTPKDAPKLYQHPANQLIAQIQVEHIKALDQSVARIEKAVLQCARELPLYQKLLAIPGIGKILGMTITMEGGDIARFKSDGDLASYCRTVDSRRLSNGRQKGENNAKCGNRYLSWAFVEAAQFARRYDQHCRKKARTSTVVATKALACKLAKAAWHVMAKRVDYDRQRMFPEWAVKEQ